MMELKMDCTAIGSQTEFLTDPSKIKLHPAYVLWPKAVNGETPDWQFAVTRSADWVWKSYLETFYYFPLNP